MEWRMDWKARSCITNKTEQLGAHQVHAGVLVLHCEDQPLQGLPIGSILLWNFQSPYGSAYSPCYFSLVFLLIRKWQLIAGLSQAQQSATRPQTTANKTKLMVMELQDPANAALSRSDILERVYCKSGGNIATEGTKVSLFKIICILTMKKLLSFILTGKIEY